MTDVVEREFDQTATPAITEPIASRWSRRQSLIAVSVLLIMAFSLIAHLGALHRDLPLQDGDEEFFVRPAANMAATGDLNPHWFGHPGSTVIYPTAALIHLWDATLHDGPIFGPNEDLEDRFAASPTPFYLIARLWAIALAVAAIPVVYLLGARAFSRRIGLVGALLWAVLPLAIHYGRVVRTESAAVFFGVLALYCCVRLWQEPRRRWQVLAGASVGFAISSRWFMVALLPCLLAAAIAPVLRDRARAVKASLYAIGSAAVFLIISTPFLLLDLSAVRRDVGAESSAVHVVADGLSPPGNARWYIATSIPDSMTWSLYALALVGVVIILYRRVPVQLMLVGFCAVFIVGISASRWHWQRWAIQVLPLLSVFAAVTVWEFARWSATRARRGSTTRVAIAAIVTGALIITPILDLIDVNRVDRTASSRRLAREWMQDNVAPGSKVIQREMLFGVSGESVAPLGDGIEVNHYLDPSLPLATYRERGYDYVATFDGDPFNAMRNRKENPEAAQFYEDLACGTRLVAHVKGRQVLSDFAIDIYRLDQRPESFLNLVCKQPPPEATAE